MMIGYTVRFAHLKELPVPEIGDIISRGDKIGRMGSTGQSDANHLHIDATVGLINRIIRLSQLGYDKEYKPDIKQLNYFVDDELFGIKPLVTTSFYDPFYKLKYRKDHAAYDLVPEDRHKTEEHFNIYWNRSMNGVILNKGFDNGYGNYILIGFEP